MTNDERKTLTTLRNKVAGVLDAVMTASKNYGAGSRAFDKALADACGSIEEAGMALDLTLDEDRRAAVKAQGQVHCIDCSREGVVLNDDGRCAPCALGAAIDADDVAAEGGAL